MKKVMLVFGTRPEAIKMCPLVKEFQKLSDQFETIECVIGQQCVLLDYRLGVGERIGFEHWVKMELIAAEGRIR